MVKGVVQVIRRTSPVTKPFPPSKFEVEFQPMDASNIYLASFILNKAVHSSVRGHHPLDGYIYGSPTAGRGSPPGRVARDGIPREL